ncbi:MAG: helix-turn-helix transcriptional regulator [Actinobacteria bacterium]|nr:helix-turn-helix transcriptional regulator [Actinomycetota bacterium]
MDAAFLLRTVRTRAGLTLRQLAERAGTSDSTLSAYESGRVTPRVDTLTRIVAAAGARLGPRLSALPERDPRRAPAGEELWQAMLLAEVLPQRQRHQRPQAPHAIFGRR